MFIHTVTSGLYHILHKFPKNRQIRRGSPPFGHGQGRAVIVFLTEKFIAEFFEGGWPVLLHDFLAVGFVVKVFEVAVGMLALQFVPVSRNQTLKGMSDNNKARFFDAAFLDVSHELDPGTARDGWSYGPTLL